MRTRWLFNLALFGVVIILGLVAMFEPGIKPPVKLPPLTTLSPDQVKKIRLVRPSDTVEFERNAQGQWQIISPVKLLANSYRLKNLLNLLEEQDYKKLAAHELKLAEIKLAPPLVQITFDQLTVAFGETSPLKDGKRYIQLSDQPESVWVVRDNIYQSLTEAVWSFVNLSPLGESIKLKELQLPDYHLILKEGTWTLAQPAPAMINSSTDTLNTLIDNWQHLQAIEVAKYDDSLPAIGEVTVTLEGQSSPLKFLIQATTPDLILARPDKLVRYKIPAYQLEELLHLPNKSLSKDEMGTPTTPENDTVEIDE